MLSNTDVAKFFNNCKLHREHGPAIISAGGSKVWYKNGKLHREDGPAFEYPSGTKEWYVNGELHREDGPAIEYANGTKSWYINGNRHREDGPAVEYPNGIKEWYFNGMLLTEEEHSKSIKTNNPKTSIINRTQYLINGTLVDQTEYEQYIEDIKW